MNLDRVVAHSGLTNTELAQLYGVSRQSFHHWRAVAPPRAGTYTARMAEVITAALVNAIDKKVLPFGGMDKAARLKRIERMAATLQALKPAAR